MASEDNYLGFPHPHPNPTPSYWQLRPHNIADLRTTPELPTDVTFDYIIIGSGISGATVAHKLLTGNPALSILMLEARTASSASSGRNGGHCRTGYWALFNRYVKHFGEDEALKILRLEETNVASIAEFVRLYQVDCDFTTVETADAFKREERFEAAIATLRSLEDAQKRRPNDAPSTRRTVWRGQEARDHTGIPGVVGAITYPGHTQNPYLLVCKMLELSLEMGLNLQTNTTALEIKQDPEASENGWTVKTNRGDVRGRQVVMATNAYTTSLHPGIAGTGFITSKRSHVSAIKMGKDIPADARALVRGSCGIKDIGYGDYFMYRGAEGHLLYGGGLAQSATGEVTKDDSQLNRDISDYLHLAPRRHLFGHEHGDGAGEDEEVLAWCGINCYTADTCPVVGEVVGDKGLWMSVGMNGHGSKLALSDIKMRRVYVNE